MLLTCYIVSESVLLRFYKNHCNMLKFSLLLATKLGLFGVLLKYGDYKNITAVSISRNSGYLVPDKERYT